ADRFAARSDRWLFLTGDPSALYDLLRHGFKVGVEENSGSERKPGYEVTHSTKLVLVDGRGHVRGYYDGTSPQSLEQLIGDARQLSGAPVTLDSSPREGSIDLPALNAVLNGLAAILLVAGYLAIRARAVNLHKACMLTALAVSGAFLTSYLYYHFVVRGG